jgi:RecB family exonuclease
VLEAFFTGEAQGRILDDGITPPEWDEFEAYALDRLNRLTELLTPAHVKGTPLALQVRLRSWPAFVKHLKTIYTPETARAMREGLREWDIDQKGEPARIGARSVPLKGTIDSVDRLPGLHLITDYKRSGTPEKASVKTGSSPQLLLYAQALDRQAELPLQRAVIGYWSILKGHWQDVLAGKDVVDEARKLGLVSPREKETLEDAIERLTIRWQARQDEAESTGYFRPDPSECGFCRFAGVCRRDDPEIGPLLGTDLVDDAEAGA